MKAAVENAGNEYLKKRTAYVQACHEASAASKKQEVTEAAMHEAAIGIREAIAESMVCPSDTLWLQFGSIVIEVKRGYKSHDGIYTHRLED